MNLSGLEGIRTPPVSRNTPGDTEAVVTRKASESLLHAQNTLIGCFKQQMKDGADFDGVGRKNQVVQWLNCAITCIINARIVLGASYQPELSNSVPLCPIDSAKAAMDTIQTLTSHDLPRGCAEWCQESVGNISKIFRNYGCPGPVSTDTSSSGYAGSRILLKHKPTPEGQYEFRVGIGLDSMPFTQITGYSFISSNTVSDTIALQNEGRLVGNIEVTLSDYSRSMSDVIAELMENIVGIAALSLARCRGIDNRVLSLIADTHPQLTRLALTKNPSYCEKDVSALTQFKSLEYLELSLKDVRMDFLQRIFESSPRLQHIVIVDVKGKQSVTYWRSVDAFQVTEAANDNPVGERATRAGKRRQRHRDNTDYVLQTSAPAFKKRKN